ncbi:MAG: alanine racemase [Holosporales bacterium]|jgi:alanine racemase|nr:alanine racemase [Holosporales bacterium]
MDREGLDLLPPQALSAIRIDLACVQHNYCALQKLLKDSGSLQTRCGSVVKANAYGTGAVPVAGALSKIGCQDFFVADCDEGIHLRVHLKNEQIYVFSGVVANTAPLFVEYNLIPVLLHKEQILYWHNEAQRLERKLPAVVHVDTGMSRSGLMAKDIEWLLDNKSVLDAFDLRFIMSHLACSCDRSALFNEIQLERFRALLAHFPKVQASFVASEGIAFGRTYHFDLVRPGKFLLGLGYSEYASLKPVIRIYGRVLEVMDVEPGQSIGYEGFYTFERHGQAASLGIGYADGIARSLGNRGSVKIKGKYAPIVGRISMDCVSIDIAGIDDVKPGDWATLVDENISLEHIAQYTGTISREVSCLLGARPYRLYHTGENTYEVCPSFGMRCS